MLNWWLVLTLAVSHEAIITF